MMAGSDFIKTSTGKEGVNATLAVGLVMCRAIREYQDVTGFRVGFKPAGGIRSVREQRHGQNNGANYSLFCCDIYAHRSFYP